MSTRRSRRKSGAASAGDDPCGSEAAAALTDSSSNTSPTRRRARDGTSPRASSKNNNEFAKNELASRILGQLNDLRNIACRQLHAGGEEIVELEHLVGGMTKSADGKSISQAQSLMSLFTSPKITSKPESGNNSTAQHSPRISCDSTKLLPIEVKVEDVVPDSPSVSYSEQQPSTSSAMTVSQSGVSLSGVASQATPTPRSSVAIGTESNVERAAKQEAQVLARVAELRRQGLWTASRLPMIDMPARNKTHWDYLLEEMRWMAADFRQERTFKRHAAKKFATQIARLQRDKEQEEERAQQRAIREAKRVCALIAKMVRDFWQNVDKVVDYRAQEIIESMKRKALDQQLELMVGQADKLSEMVQEGLTEKVSKAPSVADEDEKSDDKDVDFAGGVESESDDETTIAKAEATIDTNVEEEVQDLEREKDLELDDLLASLPAEYLASMGLPSKPGPSKARDDSEEHSDGDESENEDLDETTTDGDSEGDGEEAEGGDEDGKKDTSKADQRIPSESGEPPPKKKKSPDQVVEEETTTTSPTQCDSAMRSASSASIKESELSSSSIPPSEDASKDVPEGGINFDRLNSENSEDRQKELANIAEEALKFQPKGFTLETTQVKTDVPSLIRGTLREYQLVGLDWLVTLYDKGLNGILADEMGLGKTIQTIALLAHLACKEAIWGPHLIVVPTSVILNWEMELKKWCPAFKILTYFGSQKERAEKRRGWSKPNMFHVCVTSYKIVTQDIRAFKHKAWQYFILDEAQNIKNFKSQRWQMLLNIRARRRLLLTGTPLQNSLMELWSLMHFLMPAIFASHNDFKDWFSNPLTGMMEGNIEWNAPLVQRLHKVLRPFILRRLKSEVEKQLPEKTEHVVKCPLSKRQRYLYDDFMSLRSTRENLRSGNVMSVLNIVMQLRKCCNHPNLFEPRPVVSPFAMQALSVTVPAMLLDLCKSANSNVDIPSIPECLRLSHLMRGSQFAWSEIRRLSAGRTLIEELNSQQQQQQDSGGSSIPKVDSFKFVRPPPPPAETKQQQEVQSQQTVNNIAAVSMPAGNLPQTGEYYVCVDNGTARVYQLVTTSSGERTIQECDPSTVAGGAAASAQVVSAVEVPAAVQPIRVVTPPIISVVAQPIASTSHRDIEIKTEIKTEETVADATQMVVGSATEQHQQITTSNKQTDRRAVFRTKTVLNKTVIRSGHALKQDLQSINNGCTSVGTTIPYQVSGSSDSPTRSRCVAEVRPLTAEGVPLQTVTPMITNGEARHVSTSATVASSPPQKRRRINAPKIERQPHAELLLPETRQLQKDRRQECAQRIVDWCVRHSEWANVKRAPLVSDELLSIVINEVKRKHRPKARNATAHPEKGKMPIVELNAFECSDELDWIRDRLRQVVEDMVERFTVYVHGAIANAPSLQPTSSGRFAYRKQMDEDVNMACRHLFESLNDPLVFQCRTMQTLQFPELRLIEYDCGKLQVLSALLRDLFIYKHRCLIFTQMSRMLDVLQAFLSFHGYQYFRLDGTTGIEQRQAMMERFNSDPKIFCFILSTRSGGIGVNLTGADTVIFYDSDWNPTMDAQAQDRCHRIGQTRNVTIYRLISERTIEENILKKAMQKRRLGELAIDEAGFTPEFFKGDNLRELFQGEAAVADVVAPVSVNDPAELEKVMARLEDVQDVAAANRANAEAKAELAEFDENVQPKEDNVSNSNALDGTDSKYFELLNQLKPIERYAINFLEAEYKPDFEEEVKEAEAMIASKKDEWLKAHETVLEGGDGDELNDDDDEFDVTYANGFKIPGSIDEVRNKRGAKSTNIHASSSASNISSKVSPPQAHKQRLIPSRFSSRISAASALSSKNSTTVSQSNTKNSTNSTTTASRALRLTRRHSSDSNLKASQTSKRVSSTTTTTKSSSNDKNKSKKKVITDRTSSTTAANKRNVKSTGIDGNKSKNSKQQRSTKGRSANDKAHKGTTADVTTKVDSRGAEQKLVMKKKNKSDLSIRNEGNVLVVDSDDEHFSLPSSSNESEPQAASSSRKSRGKPTHYVSTLSDQRPLMSSSPSPLPSYPMHPTTYAVRSDRQLNTSSDDVRASTSAITPQTFSCVLVPLSPTSVISSSSTTTASPRSMTTSQSSGRSQIVGTTRGINVQPSTSQKPFSSEDIRDRYVMTTSSSNINNRQRLITSGRSLPSTSYRLVATSQSTSGVRQHISSGATAAGSTIPVQRRLVVVSRSSSSQPVSVINAQQASTSSCRPSSNIRVISTASGSSSYRVLSAARSSASPSLLYQRQQPSYFVTSGTGSDGVVSDGRRARLPSISSQGGGYTKPSLGDYERPRLFFRKRASVPQQQAQSSSEADDRASSSGNVVHMSATDSDHNATNDVDVNANTETGAS